VAFLGSMRAPVELPQQQRGASYFGPLSFRSAAPWEKPKKFPFAPAAVQ